VFYKGEGYILIWMGTLGNQIIPVIDMLPEVVYETSPGTTTRAAHGGSLMEGLRL
jgi:hypothetical protein